MFSFFYSSAYTFRHIAKLRKIHETPKKYPCFFTFLHFCIKKLVRPYPYFDLAVVAVGLQAMPLQPPYASVEHELREPLRISVPVVCQRSPLAVFRKCQPAVTRVAERHLPVLSEIVHASGLGDLIGILLHGADPVADIGHVVIRSHIFVL